MEQNKAEGKKQGEEEEEEEEEEKEEEEERPTRRGEQNWIEKSAGELEDVFASCG